MHRIRQLCLIFAVIIGFTCIIDTPRAFAYKLNGNIIQSDVWYRTTDSFSDETRSRARLAMVTWNAHLPLGKRVCYDSSYITETQYPHHNYKSVITKIYSTDSYLAENATWNNSSGGVAESDINLNASANWWNTPPPGYVDPQSVILHELGHTIGLNEVFNASAVMFPGVTPGTTKRVLSLDDINGVDYLYN